ncbi:MAG: hypothetical protein JWO02_1632 [Solirubrobacterales bacterium]|nr:hypothetical protein [Solirubrobacterales bacterium]
MRVLPSCLAVATAALATAALAGAQTTTPGQNPGQAFFHDALVKDTKTLAAIREALKTDAVIVDPATQYADLTGDGKSDAIVRVHSAGAAGVIAVYVFSTDGDAKGALRVLYRTQSLYRALTSPTDTSQLQIDEPRWAPGDDVCCPGRLTRRRYKFSKTSRTFVRTSLETINLR